MATAGKSFFIVATVGTLLFLAGNVWADDIQPPWWRGQWSTTLQGWEFPTSNPGPLQPDWPQPNPPDPHGWLPSTYVYVSPGPSMQWQSHDPMTGRTGIWPLSGEILVQVDNHNPPNEYKWMWVQLTWQPQDTGEIPILFGFNPPPDSRYQPHIVAQEPLPGPGGWFETTYEWRIYPNPPDEIFRIGGTINVDELVIDTWCIPEPGTLVLLLVTGGIGLLMFAWRRRR